MCCSAEGTAVPPNFNPPEDGRVGRNMWCRDDFEKYLILNPNIVEWWAVNKTKFISFLRSYQSLIYSKNVPTF
jgi:hypothetical protein